MDEKYQILIDKSVELGAGEAKLMDTSEIVLTLVPTSNAALAVIVGEDSGPVRPIWAFPRRCLWRALKNMKRQLS